MRNKFNKKYISLRQVKSKGYIIIDSYVYDLKKTLELHPKGDYFYSEYKGRDATERFNRHGHSKSSLINKENFLVGILDPHD